TGQAKLIVAERMIRFQFHGTDEMLRGLVRSSGVEQSSAVTEARVKVVRRHLARVHPERDAIVPVGQLIESTNGEKNQQEEREKQIANRKLQIANCKEVPHRKNEEKE